MQHSRFLLRPQPVPATARGWGRSRRRARGRVGQCPGRSPRRKAGRERGDGL